MSTPVKLASGLPSGDANGLGALVNALAEDPRGLRVVLAIVDCKKIETNTDTGEVVPVARVRRIEALLPEDKPLAERLLRRALEARTGRTVLPITLEDEVAAAFDDGGEDEAGA
jgi:hypothetical protein